MNKSAWNNCQSQAGTFMHQQDLRHHYKVLDLYANQVRSPSHKTQLEPIYLRSSFDNKKVRFTPKSPTS